MVAVYDYSKFPLVKVDLSGAISTEEDFKSLTEQWLDLYNYKTYFEFEFDTKNIGFINPYYCTQAALFIKSVKNRRPQYLKKSTIFVYNKYVFGLVKFIFYIQKPVAPVELIYIIDKDNSEVEYINNYD